MKLRSTHVLLIFRCGMAGAFVPGAFCFSQDAEPSPEDAKILEQLQKVEDNMAKSRTGNNLASVEVIREAAGSDAKAIDLWADSVREVEFKAKDKKENEWREWREGALKRLHAPGSATALRLHFQYLLLTIKASTASTEADRAEVISNLVSYFDDLARGGKDMLANRGPLDQPVLGTAVARRFKLDATVTVSEGWSPLPGDISTAYEGVILPFYRFRKDPARLQAVWNKRIQQEAALAAAADSDFQTKFFRENTQPRLEWGMARDIFQAGNPQVTSKMLLIIQQNAAHKEAPSWVREMRQLLSAPATTAVATKPEATPPPETPEESTSPGTTPETPNSENPSVESLLPGRRASTSIFPPNLPPGR
ncbi:MAG: hypothetical protein ACR2OZ_00315 [Verrucomicrobiales bacterium]